MEGKKSKQMTAKYIAIMTCTKTKHKTQPTIKPKQDKNKTKQDSVYINIHLSGK
jgi:hypothetical protein